MISKKEMGIYGERQRILLQSNEFICVLPHPSLSQYISNYNITFPTTDIMPDGFTEMPCGCATLTVENDSNSLFVSLDGPTTRSSVIGKRANQLEMFVTIEFKPGGLYAVTGISQYELINESISFQSVIPKLSKLISDAVEKAGSVFDLAAGLDRILIDNMVVAYHPQFMQTLQRIVECSGTIGVKNLSDEIYYSERQLNRIFRQHAGVSIKSFSRLLRINKSFHLFKRPSNSITLISDVLGFHDLSHFTRDFKSVCGIAPQEYRNNMSDFYINTMKF